VRHKDNNDGERYFEHTSMPKGAYANRPECVEGIAEGIHQKIHRRAALSAKPSFGTCVDRCADGKVQMTARTPKSEDGGMA
jgi:hypothetical protein